MNRLAALHLLEEVTQASRYDKPERNDELRQALRALLSPKSKRALVQFWQALDDDSIHRFGHIDHLLSGIYRDLDLKRDPAVAHAIWGRLYEARLTPEMRRARGG